MDSSESAEPMKVPENLVVLNLFSKLVQLYWSNKDQIEIWPPTAEIPCLAVKSTSKEWVKTGRMSVLGFGIEMNHIMTLLHRLFDNGRYSQASVAFLRAGRNREAAICNAHLLRENARSISITASTVRTRAFVTAASAFIACALDSPPERVNERLGYYGIAGECYSEARNLKKAGDNYRMAEQYDEAAHAYHEGGYFGEMVEVITQHGDALESGLRERLTMVAQMYYFKVYPNSRLVSKHL
jgi:hypothetical protein